MPCCLLSIGPGTALSLTKIEGGVRAEREPEKKWKRGEERKKTVEDTIETEGTGKRVIRKLLQNDDSAPLVRRRETQMSDQGNKNPKGEQTGGA